MVSASSSLRRGTTAPETVPPHVHFVFISAFSLPFIALALVNARLVFLSDMHAHLIAQTLIALDRGRLDLLFTAYPTAAYLITLFWPTPLFLMVAAALATGALLWVLWHTMAHTALPAWSRLALIAAFVLLPETLFAATQRFPDMAALLLLLLAWSNFLRFTRDRITWNGFLAGLILALAYFFSLYALVFALLYTIATPFFVRHFPEESAAQRIGAKVTATIVMGFPVLAALASNLYLSWRFTNDPWHFLWTTPSPLFYAFPEESQALITVGLGPAIASTLRDLARVPLYTSVGLLLLRYAPGYLVAYSAPVAVITVARAAGLIYPVPFALLTYLVVALAAIPRQLSARWAGFLTLVALLQMGIGFTQESQSPQTRLWQDVMWSAKPAVQDQFEVRVGRILAHAPPHRVLTDDRSAFRLIVRTGTAQPFLLPVDTMFLPALTSPSAHTDYVLVSTNPHPADGLSYRFAETPPPGFVLDGAWPGWKLYRRRGAPSLFFLSGP